MPIRIIVGDGALLSVTKVCGRANMELGVIDGTNIRYLAEHHRARQEQKQGGRYMRPDQKAEETSQQPKKFLVYGKSTRCQELKQEKRSVAQEVHQSFTSVVTGASFLGGDVPPSVLTSFESASTVMTGLVA